MRREKKRTPATLNCTCELKRSLHTTRHGTARHICTYSGMQGILFAASFISTDILTIRQMQTKHNTHRTKMHIIEKKSLRNLFPTKERTGRRKKSELSWYHFPVCTLKHTLLYVLFCAHFLPFSQMLLYHLKAAVKRTSVNCIFMK